MAGNGEASVVILAYNKAPYTRLCLQSLVQATYRPLRIIVVNNGSTDGTAALLDSFEPLAQAKGIETKLIELADNVGAIAGRNLALSEVSGDWVLFLDNDVVIRSIDLIEQMSDFLISNPEVGAVGPKLVYPRPPYLIQSAGGITTREGVSYLIGRGDDRTRIEHNLITARDWLITACMMVPTRVIRQVGEFDMVFHPIYFEDVDYCCRIRARGYQVVYFPKVEAYHFENVSTHGGNPRAATRAMRRNRRVFWRKWCHLFARSPSIEDVPWVWRSIPRVPIEEADHLALVSGDCTTLK